MGEELVRERLREMEARARWAHLAQPDDAEPAPGFVRRSLARSTAALSRGSANLAHRLDPAAFDFARNRRVPG